VELIIGAGDPIAFEDGVSKGLVVFRHRDYVESRIENVYSIAPNQRDALRLVFTAGHKIAGTVAGADGQHVANAIIKVVGPAGRNRKATSTDASGRFTLRGIAKGPAILSGWVCNSRQRIQQSIVVDRDQDNMELRLQRVVLPSDLKTYSVLGMQLANAIPELKTTYDLYDRRGSSLLTRERMLIRSGTTDPPREIASG
jgi:hypothetical protein